MAIYGKKVKLLRTLNLFLTFFGAGMSMAILGPTLLDLQRIVNTDSGHISFIYVARSAGYFLGSIIGGIVLDRYRKQPVIVCSFIFSAISIVTIPWCQSLPFLILNVLITGLFTAAVNTGTNVCCLNIWGNDCGPYLQALHFCFGLGAFVAPLIAEPFLSVHKQNDNKNITENYLNFNSSDEGTDSSSMDDVVINVHFAYGIVGIYCLLVAIVFAISIIMWPKEENPLENDNKSNIQQTATPLYLTIVCLASVFMCLYVETEITFGQMLTTFAVKGNLQLSESTGSYMTSVYWATFTFARGFSIFLVTCSNLLLPIIIDLILIVLAGICLVIFGNTNVVFLWVGVAVLGIGLSSVFPSVFAWLKSHIPINSRIASMVFMGGSLGEMIGPLSIGHFIDQYPMCLMYLTLTLGCVCTILFAIMWRLGILYEQNIKQLEEKNRSNYHSTKF